MKEIRAKIRLYNLTPQDLGIAIEDSKIVSKKERKKSSDGMAGKTVKKTRGRTIPPRNSDGMGNFWTGRGKTPPWVSNLIANGRTLDSLLIRHGQD